MVVFWSTLGVLSLLAIIRLLLRRDDDPYAQAEADRPPDLAGAVVVEERTPLRMTSPMALHGEPDVIYRLTDGTLVVREDKSFFPHPVADRIQASVYACILRHNPPLSLRGCPVAPYAWIRYGTPGRTAVHWVRVDVLSDQALVSLVGRYRDLCWGAMARPTTDAGYCVKVCQHYGSRCRGARPTKPVPPTAH